VPLCEACHGKVHQHDLTISALTSAALQAKHANGERIGTTPFGWHPAADGKSLEVDEREQDIIELVGEMRAAGRSLRRIVRALDAAGIVGRTGRPLAITQVARILNAPAPVERLAAAPGVVRPRRVKLSRQGELPFDA
jgi:hypothetical protein